MSQVAIIATGGTIAGVAPHPGRSFDYTDSQTHIAELVRTHPLREAMHPLQVEQLFNIGSEDFDASHWLKLAVRIRQQLSNPAVAGVVVTQGTDTIEETAFFLDLVLRSDKPVVVTGAMRPASALSSDVAMNLYHAVSLARAPSARGLGVLVVMNEHIHCPREVSKIHTTALDSFESPRSGPLGQMIDDQPLFFRASGRRGRPDLDLQLPEALPRVDVMMGYTGVTSDFLFAAVHAGAKGMVYAGTGNGSIATAVKPALADAVRDGLIVVRASRVLHGTVVHGAAENDDAMGFVSSGGLPAIKARVLLQLALANGVDAGRLQSVFNTF